jgi:hypothetical protein
MRRRKFGCARSALLSRALRVRAVDFLQPMFYICSRQNLGRKRAAIPLPRSGRRLRLENCTWSMTLARDDRAAFAASYLHPTSCTSARGFFARGSCVLFARMRCRLAARFAQLTLL